MTSSDKKRTSSPPVISIVSPKIKKLSATPKVVKKKAPLPRIKRTDAQWLEIIDEFFTSDKNETLFCLKKKINRSTFNSKRALLAKKYKNRKPGDILPSAH